MSLPLTLGSYQVERELGRGGMGVVYLARDPRLNRSVAIKVIPDSLAQNPDSLARFEREAKLLAAVNHPNIAAIYGVEELSAGMILVLEYVPGDTLSDRLSHGALPIAEALDIARQIASAVEAAHEAGIVHRDLKPGNVKVTPEGLVKVLDFGLAKGATASSSDLAQSPTLTYSPTAIGVILGTAGYMSPEQARGRPVDRRADIWAFACVLYECLTGKKAFEGETVSDTIARIIEREADLDALPPATPPAIRELLRRCLEKDIRKRQRDIGDVRIEIESALAGRSSASSMVIPPRAAPVRSAWQRWGIPVLCAIGGAIVAGAAMWSLGVTSRGQATTDPISVAVTFPPSIRLQDIRFTTTGHDLIVRGNPTRADGTEDPKGRLYLRKLDSFEFKEIPGTEGALEFSRSPNGKWVAVLRPVSDQSTDRRLDRVPIDGSSPPVTISEWGREWTTFKWLRDDDLMIMTAQNTKFFRLPSGGGSPKPEMPFNFGGPTGFPSFSHELPDGGGVFFRLQSWGPQGYRQDVYVLDTNTGKGTKVLDNAAQAYFDPASKHVFFARGTTLLAVPFDSKTLTAGKDPVALFEGLKANSWSHGNFEIAEDGTLAFEPGGRQGIDRRIVTVDSTRQVAPFVSESRPYEESVAISEDGRHAAVVLANTRGTYEIWRATSGQPGLRRIIAQPNADCAAPVWSPDGAWVAFIRNARDTDDGVYVQRSDGSGEAKPVLKAGALEVSNNITGWLPDGSGVLVTRYEGAKYEPVLVRISKEGVASPPERMRDSKNFSGRVRISPDGKLALFHAEDSGQLALSVAEVSGGRIIGQPVPIEGTTEVGEARWGADSKRFYFNQNTGKIMTGTIDRQPTLRASTPAVAYDLKTLGLDPAMYDILPDGRLIGIQLGSGEGDRSSTGLVLNWVNSVRARLK